MGLDMYLNARKRVYQRDWAGEGEPTPTIVKEDNMKVTAIEMEAGYWRKHPNLHGYIVQTFAAGVDECQEIELDAANLRQIASAIIEDKLPPTTGFFFGDSDWHKDEVAENAKIFNDLADWLESKDEGTTKFPKDTSVYKNVVYQASW